MIDTLSMNYFEATGMLCASSCIENWHAQMLQFLFMIIDIDRNGMDNWEPTDAVSIFGMSENSVPLNPMVLLIIIPIKWL